MNVQDAASSTMTGPPRNTWLHKRLTTPAKTTIGRQPLPYRHRVPLGEHNINTLVPGTVFLGSGIRTAIPCPHTAFRTYGTVADHADVTPDSKPSVKIVPGASDRQ
jgi:hypothetical protein